MLLGADSAHASELLGDVASALPQIDIPGLVGDDPVREGFVSGFILILFPELGDKTFFIALLLALQVHDAMAPKPPRCPSEPNPPPHTLFSRR